MSRAREKSEVAGSSGFHNDTRMNTVIRHFYIQLISAINQ